MKKEQAIVGLIAAGIGAYFLFRSRDAVAANNYADVPKLPLQPLPPGYSVEYTDPLQEAMMPKGIRNHNPMNLRYYPAIQWNGQIDPDPDGYARFETVEYGIRAGVKNLVNGYFNRGINTPRTIISRYAPSHENPTDNYIQFIADRMDVGIDEPIQLTRNNMLRLTQAIIYFENGSQPYQMSTIERGVDAGMA